MAWLLEMTKPNDIISSTHVPTARLPKNYYFGGLAARILGFFCSVSMLASMGFSSFFQGLIMKCISIAKFSILFKAEPTPEFSSMRELRQGGSIILSTFQSHGGKPIISSK